MSKKPKINVATVKEEEEHEYVPLTTENSFVSEKTQ